MIKVRFNTKLATQYGEALTEHRPIYPAGLEWTGEEIFSLVGVIAAAISGGKFREPDRYALAHPELQELIDERSEQEWWWAMEHARSAALMHEAGNYGEYFEDVHEVGFEVGDTGNAIVYALGGVKKKPPFLVQAEPPESEKA